VRKIAVGIWISCLLFLSGCLDQPAEESSDYDRTKKMVIDILQTDEGKKALADIMQDDKMKQYLVFDTDEMKDTITEGLASDKASDMWSQLFDDPTFVKKFLKVMEDDQKELFTSLMKDPTFQKQMLSLLQDKEMTDLFLSLMESQSFREHIEEIMMETLQSPLVEGKVVDWLNKQKKSGADEKKKKTEE